MTVEEQHGSFLHFQHRDFVDHLGHGSGVAWFNEPEEGKKSGRGINYGSNHATTKKA